MTRTHVFVVTAIVCALGNVAGGAQTPVTVDGWVVLPVDEYRALRERANAQPPPTPDSAVEATLTRVDYELRVENESVSGRAVLTIDVLRDGWTRVQIPAGLMVRDAKLGAQSVPLIEGPPPHVLLSRAGRFLLTLEVALPLAVSAGSESVTLPPSAAPISRATLIVPRTGVELTTMGGFVAEAVQADNESRWSVFGRPNEPLTLSWKRKVDDRRTEQPLRTRARVTSVVGLGEDVSQISAVVRVEVVQGMARDIAVSVPPGVIVNQVNGPTVADWNITDGIVRVQLLDPIASEASFVIQADMRAPRDGVINVPLVRVPGAERESGGIAVDVVGAGEIADRQARGLEQADAADLGEIVTGRESPSMAAFRFRPLSGIEPRALNVRVVRYTPQAVLVANVEDARYRALVAEDGRMLVEARYTVRNNQRSFLKVILPPGSTVWSASVAGRPTRPGMAEVNAVLLPLEKGRAGEEPPAFAIEITYLQAIDPWSEEARTRIELPAVDLPITRTAVTLHSPPHYRVQLLPGAFRLSNDDQGSISARVPPPPPPAAAALPPSKLQELVDRFRSEAAGRIVAGIVPVRITFPTFGPFMFLRSELTAESQSPSIELDYERKGGL